MSKKKRVAGKDSGSKRKKGKSGTSSKVIKLKRRELPRDFNIILYERKQFKTKKGKPKRYKFTQVDRTDFSPKKYYRIFIQHKKSKQKRMAAFGRFRHFPLEGHNPSLPSYQNFISGHYFRPERKAKIRGRWQPISKAIRAIEKEVEGTSKNLKSRIAGVMIPPKRMFHPEWKVFADRPMKGTDKVRGIAISVLLEFTYPYDQWINKRTIVVDLIRPMQIKNLHKNFKKWEFEIESALYQYFPRAMDKGEVSLVDINGFIPLDFMPKREK